MGPAADDNSCILVIREVMILYKFQYPILQRIAFLDCENIFGGSAINDVCGVCGGGVDNLEDCVECLTGYN